MASTRRFFSKNGLDNNGISIANIGVVGSSLALSGANALTLTTTAATNVTLPTSGTLAVNNQTMYLGTTAVNINRASATGHTLAGVNIGGSAGTLTTSRTIGGSSFDGSADITPQYIKDSGNRRVVSPGGATYGGISSTVGALSITLPVAFNNAMIRMTIKVYEYTTGESFEVHCGAYYYSVGPHWANGPFAYIIGPPASNRNFTIRLGNVGGFGVVYIGELNSAWSYPQVHVTDVEIGYSGAVTGWESGWTMGVEAVAFSAVTATVSNVQVGQLATASPSALGVAAVGTSTLVARSDHVHLLPSLATLGAQPAGTYATGTGSASGTNTGDVTITNDTTTNANRYIVWEDITTGTVTTAGVSSTKLYFNPSTGTLNSTIFNSLSDRNYKTNIIPLSSCTETVQQMNGYSFDWKDGSGSSYGVIAQEIEKIVPNLVYTSDGKKTVNYSAIIPFLIESMKDQQRTINKQEERIAKLESLLLTQQ